MWLVGWVNPEAQKSTRAAFVLLFFSLPYRETSKNAMKQVDEMSDFFGSMFLLIPLKKSISLFC
jgi:hypothetical protein